MLLCAVLCGVCCVPLQALKCPLLSPQAHQALRHQPGPDSCCVMLCCVLCVLAGTEAAGAVPPGPSGPSLDQPPPSGYTGDSGFSSGLGAAQDPQAAAGFGDEGETFRWDTADSGSSSSGAGWGGDDGESGGWGGVLGGDGGDSGGGDGEGPSGMWGLLVGLWAMIFGE